nr:hypothetical protein [Tanacetum cinerariifolium]
PGKPIPSDMSPGKPRECRWGKTTLLDVIFLWKEERVRLLVDSPRASTTLIYSLGSSSTSIYSPGSSIPPRYSQRASTPQSYSLGTSRNAECSNCKHLLDKITVLEATVDMYMHSEQHTVDSAAPLFHEIYKWSSLIGGNAYQGSEETIIYENYTEISAKEAQMMGKKDCHAGNPCELYNDPMATIRDEKKILEDQVSNQRL